MLLGTVSSANATTTATRGAEILGDVQLRSDRVATFVFAKSASAATFTVDFEVSPDGGSTWVVEGEYTNTSDKVFNVRVSREFFYQFKVTTAVSTGTLSIYAAG